LSVILIIRFMPDGIWGFIQCRDRTLARQGKDACRGPGTATGSGDRGGAIVLEVKGLAKYFGGLKAVDDVDIESGVAAFTR